MSGDRIDGRLALVTGAGRGIGEAVARALAARGARLILCDIDRALLDGVADTLGAVDRAVVDVADGDAMTAFAERVHARHGPLHILVNNAGVVAAGRALEMPLSDWRWMLGVNLMGVLNGCHVFGPAMVEAPGRGHIVNIASAGGFHGLPELSGYTVSKAAVLAWSEALRTEIPEAALGVSVVCPGFVPTELAEKGRFPTDPHGVGLKHAARRVMNLPGRSAADVGRAVLSAIERDRFVVPVYPEGWLMLGVRSLPSSVRRRLIPGALRAFGPRFGLAR